LQPALDPYLAEELFSKAKSVLRFAAARSTVAITAAISSALHHVSWQDILGWIRYRAACAIQS
jgi:hypothetical protein